MMGSPTICTEPPIISTRAIVATDAWLAQHGKQQGRIPREMRLTATGRCHRAITLHCKRRKSLFRAGEPANYFFRSPSLP
jgi:hypothetical protein